MHRIWFVSNERSGTATHEKCEAIEAVLAERRLEIAARTRFPDDPLPDAAALAEVNADTLMLFAGDGTINAALCALAEWDGAFLILPGGTMNLLAKALHSSLDPHAIIAAAHAHERRVALPYAEAGAHRAFVGMIVGPASTWSHAREAARDRKLRRALRAVSVAWRRSFGRGVRLEGAPRLRGRYQAVLVTPRADGLEVAGIDARDWRTLLDLGWNYLTGAWMDARAVATTRVRQLRIPGGRRAVHCLFDGEPAPLEPGATITAGLTREAFLTTNAD